MGKKNSPKETLENMSDWIFKRLQGVCDTTTAGKIELKFPTEMSILEELKLTQRVGNGFVATEAGYKYIEAHPDRVR